MEAKEDDGKEMLEDKQEAEDDWYVGERTDQILFYDSDEFFYPPALRPH